MRQMKASFLVYSNHPLVTFRFLSTFSPKIEVEVSRYFKKCQKMRFWPILWHHNNRTFWPAILILTVIVVKQEGYPQPKSIWALRIKLGAWRIETGVKIEKNAKILFFRNFSRFVGYFLHHIEYNLYEIIVHVHNWAHS